jgi:hypothetical protein
MRSGRNSLLFVINESCSVFEPLNYCRLMKKTLASRYCYIVACTSRCYAIIEYTMTVSQQRLGKYLPTEMNKHVAIDILF